MSANNHEPQEIAITPFWAERNFLVLPFFILDKHSKADIIEYRGTIRQDNKLLDFEWKVYGRNLGLPTAFDWQVHRAIESVLSELPLPISNPIRFSLYDLIERMGITHGGYAYKRIRQSIERIILTGIQSNSAFYSKPKEHHIKEVFHLYERVVFRSDLLDDGTVADTNHLWLGSWYLDNVNARYTKPLDQMYYRSLRKPIAKRIYEIIGVKFFGLPGPQTPLRQNYSELCQVIGIEVQPHYAWARKVLKEAHEELSSTGFLAKYEWSREGKQPYEWYVFYTMGSQATAEINQARTGTHMPPRISTSTIVSDHEEKEADTEHPLIAELVERDVLRKRAKHLVDEYPEQKISLVVEYTDWYRTQRNRVERWGPYIIKLVEDPDFDVSADFRRAKAAEAARRKAEMLQVEAEGIQSRRLGEALENWSDDRYFEYQLEQMRERHRVMGRWVQKTQEQIQAEEERIRSRLPKDEEERIEMLLGYEHYQVAAIVEELNSSSESRPPSFVLSEETDSITSEEGNIDEVTEADAETESQLSFLDFQLTE